MHYSERTSRRKAYNLPKQAHELTFSCYHKFPFLKAERCRRWLAESINRARIAHSFDVWGFVVMPDHVHLLIRPLAESYDISRILKSIKQPVAQRAIHYLEEIGSPWLERIERKRGARVERLFWQSGGGYDRNLCEPSTLLAAIDYIHLNPVRKGLAERASDWPWSSACWYERGEMPPIPIDPIPVEWLS